MLIHFTRNHRRETNAAITVEGIRIDPAKEAKYLGVIFDQKLQFKKHLQYIIRKGTSAALALSDIAKNNWGAKYKYVRQLFKSVIAARTDYAAIIWHQPKDNDKIATESQVSKLSAIQRLAMKAITGCYKTTPTAAMEIEAGLQPTWPHLQTKVLQAVARMQTLSAKHPLQKWIKNAMRTRTSHCRHQSNLENILQQFPQTTEQIETIEPYIRPPWWTPKVEIRIERSKDEARDKH